jgi:methyl-CpG-binding domain protein 4
MTTVKTPRYRSPYGLIQEELRDDAWRLLVACQMLNLTSIKQVRPVILRFFDLYPDALTASRADQKSLSEMLRPLGLQNRRARTLIRFSKAWQEEWSDVEKLPGVGKYAADSYTIFVEGRLDVSPTDTKLKKYIKWAIGADDGIRNQMHQDH